ncbi:MAG: hypothetical protein HQL71_07875 [Magnetococcales bacterium]|nr:hypothetical protein [Magnetococcales bacterium]
MDKQINNKTSLQGEGLEHELPPNHLVLISAAVYTIMGSDSNIKSVKRITQAGSSWAKAGRSILHRNSPNR